VQISNWFGGIIRDNVEECTSLEREIYIVVREIVVVLTTSGVAKDCVGCAMHKGPRWSKGPLEASRVNLFKSKGF